MAFFGSNISSEVTKVNSPFENIYDFSCERTQGDRRKYQLTARIEMEKEYWVGLRLLLCPLGSNVVIRTACCSVGVILPVYSTFKAIEKKDQNEQQKWLIYWAAYGSFSLLEAFADKLISWVPMYYHVKLAFLVWLQLPSADGAKQLYKNHLRPFFLRHQARVDLLVDFTYGEMVRIVSTHRAEIEYARAVFLKIMGPAEQTGNSESDHSGEHLAIEGETRAITNTESDSDD